MKAAGPVHRKHTYDTLFEIISLITSKDNDVLNSLAIFIFICLKEKRWLVLYSYVLFCVNLINVIAYCILPKTFLETYKF